MGWVTLSLRKQALKQEHSYYQLRLLQISREKRQLHRKKSAEIKGVQVEQNQTLREARETYNSAREAKNNAIKERSALTITSNISFILFHQYYY